MKTCITCGSKKGGEDYYSSGYKGRQMNVCKTCTKNRNDKRRRALLLERPAHLQFLKYQARCRRNGRDFELTEFDFEVCLKAPCAYCNETATGFDRLDSEQGYTYENITPCCATCNRMKLNHTLTEFITRAQKIAQNTVLPYSEGSLIK